MYVVRMFIWWTYLKVSDHCILNVSHKAEQWKDVIRPIVPCSKLHSSSSNWTYFCLHMMVGNSKIFWSSLSFLFLLGSFALFDPCLLLSLGIKPKVDMRQSLRQVSYALTRPQSCFPFRSKELNNWIDPTVKHVWNVAMHVLHIFWSVINTTAYHSGRSNLHLLLLKSSMPSSLLCSDLVI